MEMIVAHINAIWDEILEEKIIKKNRQYGNSVYDSDTIFSRIGDPEELIKIRLDDKMRRLKTLDPDSPKFDSEIKEIIAYLIHLLNWRKNAPIKWSEALEDLYARETDNNSGYERDTFKSPEDTGAFRRRPVCNVNIRGLPDK